MRGLINYQFKSIGLKNIFNLDLDTYQNNQLFFSYRRSKHDNLLEQYGELNMQLGEKDSTIRSQI